MEKSRRKSAKRSKAIDASPPRDGPEKKDKQPETDDAVSITAPEASSTHRKKKTKKRRSPKTNDDGQLNTPTEESVVPKKQDKQQKADDAVSTTNPEASSHHHKKEKNKKKKKRSSTKTNTHDDSQLSTAIDKSPNVPDPKASTTNQPTVTGKRKRGKTSEKSSKKRKSAEELPEPTSSSWEDTDASSWDDMDGGCPLCGGVFYHDDSDGECFCGEGCFEPLYPVSQLFPTNVARLDHWFSAV